MSKTTTTEIQIFANIKKSYGTRKYEYIYNRNCLMMCALLFSCIIQYTHMEIVTNVLRLQQIKTKYSKMLCIYDYKSVKNHLNVLHNSM